jgi:hypothetical protein
MFLDPTKMFSFPYDCVDVDVADGGSRGGGRRGGGSSSSSSKIIIIITQ